LVCERILGDRARLAVPIQALSEIIDSEDTQGVTDRLTCVAALARSLRERFFIRVRPYIGEIQQTPPETCAVGSERRSHPTRVNSSRGRDRRAPDHVLLDLLGVGRCPHAAPPSLAGLTENSYRNSSLALFATVRVAPKPLKGLEREKGFEPSTSTLARWHSTTELLPRNEPDF
jgi:hypothetical protein